MPTSQQKGNNNFESQNTVFPLAKETLEMNRSQSFTRLGFFGRILGCQNASVEIDPQEHIEEIKYKEEEKEVKEKKLGEIALTDNGPSQSIKRSGFSSFLKRMRTDLNDKRYESNSNENISLQDAFKMDNTG